MWFQPKTKPVCANSLAVIRKLVQYIGLDQVEIKDNTAQGKVCYCSTDDCNADPMDTFLNPGYIVHVESTNSYIKVTSTGDHVSGHDLLTSTEAVTYYDRSFPSKATISLWNQATINNAEDYMTSNKIIMKDLYSTSVI